MQDKCLKTGDLIHCDIMIMFSVVSLIIKIMQKAAFAIKLINLKSPAFIKSESVQRNTINKRPMGGMLLEPHVV